MPNSMTGFARKERQAPWGTLSCEIRSVNHRYLEPIVHLPDSLRVLEVLVREQCRKQLHRGKVEVNIQLEIKSGQDSGELSLNQPLIDQLTQAAKQISDTAEQQAMACSPVDPLALLQWPGVIEQQGVDMAQIESSAAELIAESLQSLIEHRRREGQDLQAHIQQRLDAISDYVGSVRAQMPSILQAQHEKLQQRLVDLATDIEPERLAQEVAILANKADVDEELDRLSTHVEEVKHILSQKGAIGRRLDFMMQELNREANTLSSKAIHTDTTQAAVSLKVLIEQMREQIQNIE